MDKKIKIFISYSHKDNWIYENDKSFILALIRYFEVKEINSVEFWFDPSLAEKVGKQYEPIIKDQIRKSDFALLLLSNEFKTSKFIREVEMQLIIEQYNQSKIQVIPILISKVNLSNDILLQWLLKTQILPSNNSPLSEYFDNIDKREKVKTSIFDSLDKRFNEFLENRQNDWEHGKGIVRNINDKNYSVETVNRTEDVNLKQIVSETEKTNEPNQRQNSKVKKRFTFSLLVKISFTAAFICTISYFIFFQDHNIKGIYREKLIINQLPAIDSLGGDEKFDIISGEVRIDSPENYRIVVYAYTNMWYIQPSFNKPFTVIIKGEWTTETHLGKKYAVMLVKKEYEPKNMIFNLPDKSDNIIEIKITP
jgi:hypothetical protein